MRNANIKAFKGQHCETTATGTLLNHLGIELTEPMLFGLGEGLSYGAMKFGGASFPFFGGRIRTGHITQNICNNLGLQLHIKKTASLKKAWKNVDVELEQGTPVGLQLDCYYLNYFTNKIHFAGHFVAMTGYDEEYAYLVDTQQQGGVMKTTLESLEEARSSKQPMSEKNLSYTITKDGPVKAMAKAVKTAIVNNAKDFLNPPIRNFGYKGIIKTSQMLEKWYDQSEDVNDDFSRTAMLMERAGTGGGLFRNLYRDFLKEAYHIINEEEIIEAYELFEETALMWTEISKIYEKVAETKDIIYIKKASEILLDIADKEYKAMSLLEKL